MFDKKARTISDHMILMIPKFIYLIVAFLSVVFLMRMLVTINIDSSEAEASLASSRIIYSPNIISYLDPDTNRAYPGIIDIDKYKALKSGFPNSMDTETMTYGQENRLIASKLILKNLESNQEDIIFYNKESYEFWEPRALPTVQGGSGSVKAFAEQRYVLIKDGNKLSRGVLNINTILRTG